MIYFTTETLLRTLLLFGVLDLAILAIVLWYGWHALWSANRVLRNIDIEYRVQQHMRKWRAERHAAESKSEAKEASLAK